MRVLYYDCFSGISGDMHLGAMIDIGVDPDFLLTELGKLQLSGYEIKISKDIRKGISGTRVNVITGQDSAAGQDHDHNHHNHQHDDHHHDHHHHNHLHHHQSQRKLSDIAEIINSSQLSDAVKKRSMKMFEKLGAAEAKIHNKDISEIHFHEVGAVDSIIDIVGAAICLESLKPDRIISSSIELGGGFVDCDHGKFPVPAPATAEILSGIPVSTGAVNKEATTPTGAVIIACNVDEFAPMTDFIIEKTAYGIGNRDTEIPNVLRIYWGKSGSASGTGLLKSQACVVECNIDDMNPEYYAPVMEKLFEEGADDVYITPIQMKKARPASTLSALCDPDKVDKLTELMLTTTTSLGVRKYKVEKTYLEREFRKVKTSYGEVSVKTAIYKGKRLRSKPEFDDCARIAKEKNIAVSLVVGEVNRILNNEAGDESPY